VWAKSPGAARPQSQDRDRADARNDRPRRGGHRLERQAEQRVYRLFRRAVNRKQAGNLLSTAVVRAGMEMRSLRLALIAAILAACGPVAGSPAASGSPQPAVALVRPTPTPTETSGCPTTTPVTEEHPKNSNTAAFSRGWYVSPDRLLWASASGPFVVGSNKVLWERPGPAVAVTGKLLSGDAKAAGVPTITGPAATRRATTRPAA
jgi:hypothetical protein